MNGIKNFVLNISDEDKGILSKSEIYEKFINVITPTTLTLFNVIKKYIHGKLSIMDVVNYMEPFLIYSDDLTFKQYQAIISFISQEIFKFNKTLPEKHRLFLKMMRLFSSKDLSFQAFSVTNILSNKDNLRENVLDSYDFYDLKANIFTNSENLRKIIVKDFGHLYYNAISIEGFPLVFSNDLEPIFDAEKDKLNNKLQSKDDKNTCKNYVVAKQYSTLEDLLTDNNVDIYFDKKFDNTKYSLLDEFQKELVTMTPEDFFTFLVSKLMVKLRLKEEEAEYLADTLITGVKKVLDGQYAIIYHINNVNETLIDYYVRNHNKWELDEKANKDLFTANQNILCNFQEKCISIPEKNNVLGTDDKCISLDRNETQLKEKFVKDIINEFDEKYLESKEIYEKFIREKYNYYQSVFPMLNQIELDNLLKYNNQKFRLGAANLEEEKPLVVSPYFKLRDYILGQQDFTKKQNDIVRFVSNFTREAYLNIIGPLGEQETMYWLYCNQTNVKLLPSFIYNLASCFINNYDNYNTFMDLTIKEIGTLSDDGDAWVDKHSGYVIKKIDFDVEEGYEEGGFKIKSRDVLEQDLGDTVFSASKNDIKITSPQSKMISNIITTLSMNMGINMDTQKEFIISTVNAVLSENLPSESSYKKKIQEMANKGKNIPSYKELYNSFVLYFSLGMYLIGVQTSIPSIKTRKTYPGCVRSFVGYPLEGAGDLSSLQYLACIAHKIRGPIDPWSVLLRKKETDISGKIKEYMDRFLLSIPEVIQKMKEKTEFLLTEPADVISKEHNIFNWKNFLPPLVPIKMKNFNSISSEFKNKLTQNLKSGSRSQREDILVIESKIIYFSLSLQEKIQNILQKEKLILSNAANEPYLENACCIEKGEYTTIRYFEERNKEIEPINQTVFQLSSILIDIKQISQAILFSTKVNTKNIYPSLNTDFNEETIYLAFIKYCHFNSLLPVNENLISLCSEKPDYLVENDSISEMIRKLKSDGRNYNNASFLRLLQIVGKEKIININLDPVTTTTIQKFRDILELISLEKDKILDSILIKLLNNVMDTFDIVSGVISDETKALNNYLIKSNDSVKKDVLEYIKKNSNADKKDIKIVDNFLNTQTEWESDKNIRGEEIKISDDSLYNGIQFFKSYIQNLTDIFPNIILNKVNYNNSEVPKYWGLSDYHNNDIKSIIKEYYIDLQKFYSDSSLISVLNEIQVICKNLVILSKETPSFTSIKYKENILKPIFDERTSKLLFEFYFLKIIDIYMKLSEDQNMVVKEVKKPIDEDELFSVDYLEDNITNTSNYVTEQTIFDKRIIKGNKKELRQKVSNLIISYIRIMSEHKNLINTSYDLVMDRVFKLKEKEKNMFTDRLKSISDEERNVDTILKINKLGVWSKGLQKGLTTYVKENYDDERDFADKMNQYEKILTSKNKNITSNNVQQYLDDFLEEMDADLETEKEAYDMSDMIGDYDDGNFEGDELEENDYYDDN